MTKELFLAFGIIAAIPLIPVGAHAQGRAADHRQVQGGRVTNVSTGYRGSKLVGAPVTNQNDEKIGTVDDIIVTPNDRVVYAIVAVGGFLGVGDKLVAAPFEGLRLSLDETILPGATKETLMNMPKFTYQK